MSETTDCIVVGAGVIGLACARALARTGRDVLVVERHEQIGVETSSRNSEVIHAGIYYPRGSVKATLCVRGKTLLYDYCHDHHVAFRRCGKVIVATDEAQLAVVESYREAARANGAGELARLGRADIAALEPDVACVGGVISESTGIIDSHGYMLSLQADLEACGGTIAFGSTVIEGHASAAGIRVVTDSIEVTARVVVNAGGLGAPDLALRLPHMARERLPRARYAKGHYYAYDGVSPFRRLVYPVAEPGGLGVHVTLDLAGQARFGPDVVWVEGVDYTFDERNRERITRAIRRYFPALDESRLHPSYTGIRPKISGPDEPAADFAILGPADHGVRGLVHLLGIESPGLTASLAIADVVVKAVEDV